MCTYGTPAKFSYCAAENEAASPWDPLHVERGFARQASTVTVVAAEAPQNINDHESLNAEGILQTMAGNMCMPGVNDIHHPAAEPVVLICPEHAQALAAGGYSKAAVKQYFFAHARVPLGSFSDENRERRLRQRYPEQYGNATLDTMVPVVKAAENFTIVVIGGAGKHSAFIPTFGSTRSVTRALRHADGSDVLSIDELRQN